MIILNAKPVALRCASFVMSEEGQTVLRSHGLDPVALAASAQP
jgi:hypothetical protein